MRHLNKIQKLIWFEMETQATEIDVSCIFYSNKFFNLLYMILEILNLLYYFVLFMQHKNIFKRYFEVKIMDKKLVHSHTF